MSKIDWSQLKTVAGKLDEHKARLRNRVNQIRDDLMSLGVEYGGVLYQTRPQDRENVSGAVQLAVMAQAAGEPFETEWIAMDNSVVVLEGADVIGLGRAIAARKSQLVFRARSAKEQVDLATSAASLPDVEVLMAD